MLRRKIIAALVGTVAASLALTACGGSSGAGESSGSAGADTTLTLAIPDVPTSLSAQDIDFANSAVTGQAIYDSLLKADPEGKVGPYLATEWKYNDDQTELTLTLRSDVTFSDGTKFNAEAAAQNLIRFRDGNSPRKSVLADMVDAKATDDTHVVITLSAPDPGLLIHLTQVAGYVQAPSSFDKPDEDTNPVGSGPYIVDPASTVIGDTYSYTANPNYWDKPSQHYQKLVLKVLRDPTALLNAVKGGQVNGAKPINDIADQVKAAGYTLSSYESDWMGVLLLDRDGTINPALKDVRVRQAINYAFDRASLLTAIGKNYGDVTTQIFPTSSAAYDAALDEAYPYDPAKARALLAEAGYASGLTIDMPTTAALGTSLWTLLGQQLNDVGITVNFTDAGPNFLTDLLAPKYAASWMQLQMDPDWPLINFSVAPDAQFNPFHTTDPKVEDLIHQIQYAATEADAAGPTKELNEYLVEQAWFAPWYRIQSNYATDANTSVVTQVGNSYPYLWNFTPKS